MTADDGPFVLLDVSRLISRIGLGPLTGIDRVEAAWLDALEQRPHALLARIPRRQLLLPPEAGPLLRGWLRNVKTVPPARGVIATLRRARSPRARAEEALARIARVVGTGTGRFLRLPPRVTWLNVGHANLSPGPWAALRSQRKAVLIHDTIPLDFPHFTRAGQSAVFRRRLTAALTQADTILTVSQSTRDDVIRWRDRLGLAPRAPVIAAPIGTDIVAPDAGQVPADLPLDRPFFVVLGTIEPRKNHALLLDAWALLQARLPPGRMPRLLVLGRRGWRNPEVFARLDALPPDGAVIERAGLTDGAIAALLLRCHALLMPSRAEGFGLPLTEAAARGVPILATPLPSACEVLGGTGATWLAPDDPAAWADAVASRAEKPIERLAPRSFTTWDTHVTGTLRILSDL